MVEKTLVLAIRLVIALVLELALALELERAQALHFKKHFHYITSGIALQLVNSKSGSHQQKLDN